jgi:hypothetical protein
VIPVDMNQLNKARLIDYGLMFAFKLVALFSCGVNFES